METSLLQPVASVSSLVPGNLVYSTVGTGLKDMGDSLSGWAVGYSWNL
jgi:hypothetical protein